MKAVGRYDGNLQMFVEEARDVDMVRLGFLRWLAENGKLEHKLAGPAAGRFAGEPEIEDECDADDWRIPTAA